jgi:hypothetical protein
MMPLATRTISTREYAFREVHKQPQITEQQVAVIDTIVNHARYNNNFDEDRAVYQTLAHPQIGNNQAQVLCTLAAGAREENDFDEDWAFAAVAQSKEFSSDKAAELNDIFRNAPL